MATKQLSLKLLIDTKAQKVCFAEAGNDVVEFLSTLLCLPVGTIINLVTKERMVGSIGNVLGSVQELDTKYMISTRSKERYVSPAIAPNVLHPLQQLLDVPVNVSDSFFTCPGKTDSYGIHVACGYFSAIKYTICPNCFKSMGVTMKHVKDYGMMVGTATYTMKDDLSITPASSVSSIALLAKSGVNDMNTLQERTVKIGKEEIACLFIILLKEKKAVLVF